MIVFSGARIEPRERYPQYNGVPGISDIALGLGRTPRFAGQTRIWWSGLHHALICADLSQLLEHTPRVQFLCLTHDAHEAVTGDVPAFFKPPKLSRWQKEIDRRLFTSWGVWPVRHAEHAQVKLVDDLALSAEASVVGPPGIMAHLASPAPAAVEVVKLWAARLNGPALTDGIESQGAREFYARYAALYGDAVLNRRNDTKRD